MNKVLKRTFTYFIFAIFIFCISLMTINIESHLTISAYAQDEREIVFENYNIRAVSIVDAMTDKKFGAIFVDFGKLYIAITSHDFFRIWSYDHRINFTSDAAHLIRVGENEPFSLLCDTRNTLFPRTYAEAESVIQSLVKGEEVILRYYEDIPIPFSPSKETPYEQVDIKLKNTFLGFVYHKVATLFGWHTLGTSPNLPPVKLNIYTPTDPDSEIEVQVNIQENPDLMLTKRKGSPCADILIGGKRGFRINIDMGEVVCQSGTYWGHKLKIYDSSGNILYNEKISFSPPFFETTKKWPEGEIAAKKALEAAPIGRIVVEEGNMIIDRWSASLYGFRELWQWGVDNLNFPSLDTSSQILDDYATYEKKLREGNILQGSLHCSNKAGYTCPSCTAAQGYDNHFKGFNVLTTQEDCYVKLTYNNGDYIGSQNDCEVTIQGEKWLGLESEAGIKLVEAINEGNFNFKLANKFDERTMNIPGDNYKYEFANGGKEFRLYLSRDREEAFKAVPWQNMVIEIKNKETNNVFKYKFEKGIFPLVYSWNSGGMANYGQCVWWAAKRWVEEVDPVTLFPFYPPSPQAVNVKIIDSNYQPKKYDVLISYDPAQVEKLGHYGFVEKVDGDKIYITQFNFIPPGEVYNHVPRAWNGNARSLYYSNNPSDLYYFKYYYRK